MEQSLINQWYDKLLNTKFEEAIDYHLPKRTLSDEVRLDNATQNSIDKLQQLVQTIKSDKTNTNPTAVKATLTPPTSQEIRDEYIRQQTIAECIEYYKANTGFKAFIKRLKTGNTWLNLQYEFNISKTHLHRIFTLWTDCNLFKNVYNINDDIRSPANSKFKKTAKMVI